MKHLYILMFAICLQAQSLKAQTYCDSLYYQLDPSYVSLHLQEIIMQTVLDCHFDQGEPDTLSLYDRYFTGSFSDNVNEVEMIFFEILEEYVQDYPGINDLVTLNELTRSIDRSSINTLSLDSDELQYGSDNSSFLDDQLDRLMGNASEAYFINEIEYLPLAIGDAIEDFAARKVAYIEARDGYNLFEEASTRPDSTQFINSTINIALLDPTMSLSPLFSRHLNYYVLAQQEAISELSDDFLVASTNAISANDTSFVQSIDEAGINASNLYDAYRYDEQLKITRAFDTLSMNTELNLEALQCIQDELTSNIDDINNHEENWDTNNPLSDVEQHDQYVSNVIQSGSLIDAYMAGNIKLADVSAVFGSIACTSGLDINGVIVEIKERPDMSSLAQMKRFLDKMNKQGRVTERLNELSDILNEKGFMATLGIFTASVYSGETASQLKESIIDLGEGFDTSVFTKKRDIGTAGKIAIAGIAAVAIKAGPKLLKKLFPKGIKALAKSNVKMMLGEMVAKRILNEQVTVPILNAINGLRQEMNARFEVIDQKLDKVLELQVKSATAILDGLQTNNELIQDEFNNLDYSINEILNNQANIQSQIQDLLEQLSGLGSCPSIMTLIENTPIETYDDLLQLVNGPLSNCLNGLRTVIQTTGSGNLDLTYYRGDPTQSNGYGADEINNFKMIVSLYDHIYGVNGLNRYDEAAAQLLIETDNTVDASWDFAELVDLTSTIDYPVSDAINVNNYLDVDAIKIVLDFYRELHPFYEIFENNANLDPLELQEFLDDIDLNDRNSRSLILNEYSYNLLRLTQMARAQQALMSGHMIVDPMYRIIYEDAFKDDLITFNGQDYPIKQFVINILRNNSTIATNFSTITARFNHNYNTNKYNLVTNGTFSYGDQFFDSDLIQSSSFASNRYDVVSNAEDWDQDFESMLDKTPVCDDNMFLMTAPPGPAALWRQEVDVTPGQYRFKCYTAEPDEEEANHNFPEIYLSVNGTMFSDTLVIPEVLKWYEVEFTFDITTAQTLTLEIRDANASSTYNNPAIDDISLVQIVDPSIPNFVRAERENEEWQCGNLNVDRSADMANTYGRFGQVEYESFSNTELSQDRLLQYVTLPNSITCNQSGGLVCNTSFPVARKEILDNDLFIYKEGYTIIKVENDRMTNLHVNTQIPRYYPQDWQSLQMTKAIITNSSNQ